MTHGICYIIGAGPGDIGLITVKGLDCLRRADIVFYDRLVNPQLLDAAPAATRRVYVGKQPGQHPRAQGNINTMLCEAVKRGQTVVRLKGGDPFVFGRGGEEADALARAGLAFEIIPGVSAAMAAAASMGIPLTQRPHAAGLTMVTGHESTGKDGPQVDWRALARFNHTLCVYMGLHRLEWICRELMAGGRPPDEPVAVIQWASLPSQRCITAPLSDVAEIARASKIGPPSLIIIGNVVHLRNRGNTSQEP